MKSFNLSEWALNHRAMVLFLIVTTLIVGVFSFTQLGRLEDPNFNVPTMTITVAWPGANAQQVQDEVLNRIERKLQDIDGIDYLRSFSRQGYGGIIFWMKGGSSKKTIDNAWYLARKKIGDIKSELPDGVRGPFLNDEFTDVYTVIYALHAKDLSWGERQKLAEDIKRSFQSVQGLNKVDIYGKQEEKVYVEFSSKHIAALGLTPQAIMAALARQNVLTPSGLVEGKFDRVFVRVSGGIHNIKDVESVTIEAGGKLLHLSDVATVTSGVEDPSTYSIRHNGEPVIALGVTMSRNGNILALGKALDKRLAEIQSELPIGVTLVKYADQPKVVDETIWEFEKSFLEALVIVLIVSFLALGWRTGIVVAFSVPLVLGLVAFVMYMAGWALDRISLGALIIALGLLVDDAIIAVEMMVVKMEQGWDRVKAATFAYTSTAFPMLTGTLLTVVGFMPVGFANSISGEYAGGIFWVVGLALIASWLVAVVFTPYLGVKLLPEQKIDSSSNHDPYNKQVYKALRNFVDWCLRRRWWVIGTTFSLLLISAAGMSLVQQQFFPTASRPELLVDLKLKDGSSFKATEIQVKRVEKILASDKQIQSFVAYTGAGSLRFFLSLSPELPNPGFAQFVIKTAGISEREAIRKRLMKIFDSGEMFPDLNGRVQRLEFGPPVGFPVQFRIIGPDKAKAREIAYKVRDIVRKSPLVRDTQLEWNEQVRTLKVVVDQDKLSQLGLASSDVSNALQTLLSGASVTQMRRGEELIDIVVRATADERLSLEHLQDIKLFSKTGNAIPLSQVAKLETEFEDPVLWRRNRDSILTVRSDLADGVQGPYATQKIMPSLDPVIKSLPTGYRIELGGAIEESDKSNKALFAVFPVMFAVMLLILMMQLQNFSRMWLVFMTAPLGLIGVVPALLIFNAPFGFVALLGVIALGGMIMRNSVILVDQIDQDIKEGAEPWNAIVDATVRRSRPVVLTAAAAVLSMIPLSHSIFWGPMAIAIMGGLVAATALTLAFVPSVYAAWFKVTHQAKMHS